MYSKEEMSRQRAEFWTIFGKYMAPVPSAFGEPVNWINYKSGVPGISFRKNADRKHAVVSVEFLRKDGSDSQYHLFRGFMGETWFTGWVEEQGCLSEHGRMVDRIVKKLEGVSIMQRGDWPAIISFLKPALIEVDAFWMEHKLFFE